METSTGSAFHFLYKTLVNPQLVYLMNHIITVYTPKHIKLFRISNL